MKNLKSMGLFMGILLCAILFSACAQDIPDEAGGPGNISENDGDEPEPQLSPRVYEVIITLTNDASAYTREDFPEAPLSPYIGFTRAGRMSVLEYG
jgi:hypothetical protein